MAEGAWPVGEQEVAVKGGKGDEADDSGRVIITSSAEGGGAVERDCENVSITYFCFKFLWEIFQDR